MFFNFGEQLRLEKHSQFNRDGQQFKLQTQMSQLVHSIKHISTQTQVPATATISTAAVLSGLIDALHSAPSYIIQPPATVEWIIHNIFYRAPCVVVYTNGTNTIMTFNPTTGGQTLGLIYHVSNALYFVLYCTNANASTNQFGFNGVRSL